ncbi:unnamed protein product [Pleuronectes platessa]|uniref:Regulator of microtubule dynamics 2 n=1 Tax=Pleuronectes platessa TaxID=8262 RepID=A0A9N7YLJ8_PLEPL|nr:unnamed protein product [Pleuronectes platessa]
MLASFLEKLFHGLQQRDHKTHAGSDKTVTVKQGKQDFNKNSFESIVWRPRMALADGKVLVLGALAGVAGVSLAVMYYQGFSSRRRASWAGPYSLPMGQAEVLDRLEALHQCVSELKDEMKALKNALPTLQAQVKEELTGRDEARRASPLHRTTPTRRKRPVGAISSTRAEARSSEEAESEGGYMTALTDSEDEEISDEEQREEEQPEDKLSILLERIDSLHHGTESDKRESLNILLEHKEQEFGQNPRLLWRLLRAYSDVHDVSATLEDKKTIAQTGKTVGEEAVSLNPTCADSHRW